MKGTRIVSIPWYFKAQSRITKSADRWNHVGNITIDSNQFLQNNTIQFSLESQISSSLLDISTLSYSDSLKIKLIIFPSAITQPSILSHQPTVIPSLARTESRKVVFTFLHLSLPFLKIISYLLYSLSPYFFLFFIIKTILAWALIYYLTTILTASLTLTSSGHE